MSLLIDILDRAGYLPAPQGAVIERICRHKGVPFVGSLLELGIVDEEALFTLFKNNSTYSSWDESTEFNRQSEKLALDSVQAFLPLMEEFEIYPLSREDGVMVVACTDPSDRALIQKLEFFLNCRVKPVLAKKSQIHAALRAIKSDFNPRVNKFPLDELLPHVSQVRQLRHLSQSGYDVPSLDERVRIAQSIKKSRAEGDSPSRIEVPTEDTASNVLPAETIEQNASGEETLLERTQDETHLAELAKEISDDFETDENADVSATAEAHPAEEEKVVATRARNLPQIAWSNDPVVLAVQKARLATSMAPHNDKAIQESVKGFALAGLMQGLITVRTIRTPAFQALAHWRRADDKSMFYSDEGIQHYVKDDVNEYLTSRTFEGHEVYDLDDKDPPDCLRKFAVWANSEQALYIYRAATEGVEDTELIIVAVAAKSIATNQPLQNEIKQLMATVVQSYGVT